MNKALQYGLFVTGLVTTTVLFSKTAFASESPLTLKTLCKPSVEKMLAQWGSLNQWKKQPLDATHHVYYTPTETIGTWIEVKPKGSSEIKIERIGSNQSLSITYLDSRCQPEFKLTPRTMDPKIPAVSDAKLAEVFEKEKNGFVYIWSPQMPLSLDGVDEIMKAAKKLKLSLTVLLDPNADVDVAKKIASKRRWPASYALPSASYEVNFRGMLHHFPTLLTFHNGKPVSPLIPGLRSAKYYQEEARRQGL